jgi:6-phosphogluconate dehydrogenase (decarboxylating)
MQLGMVGLGRMGSNLARRLLAADHDCVVFDVDPSRIEYGVMAAYAEGLNILENANAGTVAGEADAHPHVDLAGRLRRVEPPPTSCLRAGGCASDRRGR